MSPCAAEGLSESSHSSPRFHTWSRGSMCVCMCVCGVRVGNGGGCICQLGEVKGGRRVKTNRIE